MKSRRSNMGLETRNSHQINAIERAMNPAVAARIGGEPQPNLWPLVKDMSRVTKTPVDSAAPNQSNPVPSLDRSPGDRSLGRSPCSMTRAVAAPKSPKGRLR